MENKCIYVLRYPEKKPDKYENSENYGGHEYENISLYWSEKNAGKYVALNICPYAVGLEHAKRFSLADIEDFRKGLFKWFEVEKIDRTKNG